MTQYAQYIPYILTFFCAFNFIYLFAIMYRCGQLTERLDLHEEELRERLSMITSLMHAIELLEKDINHKNKSRPKKPETSKPLLMGLADEKVLIKKVIVTKKKKK